MAVSSFTPAVPATTDLDVLARRYAATRDPNVQDVLVRRCEALVRGIASGYRNGSHDDDLAQVGFLGLLNAIEHYDPSRGTPFLPFARHYVRGEIRHYLRDHHSLVRRPRWLERASGLIEQAVGEHLDEHGRYPGVDDLASTLGLAVDAVTEILRTRGVVRTLSLDAADEEGQSTVDLDRTRCRSDDPSTSLAEDRIVLLSALESVNPLQRAVVFYLFFTDLTQAEAAARLGISQKHVSRVLASTLHRLREILMPAPSAAERV